MSALDHSALGQLVLIGERLEELLAYMRKGDEWGAAGDLNVASWAAGATWEYDYDGVFKAAAVFNLSAQTINFAFTDNGAAPGGQRQITLSARGFLILPYRGTHVSVGGANAGTALVVLFSMPQPVNAGTF
jgi:hypothetical protein